MKRRLLGDLSGWLHRNDRKPLLVRGARQVGKTWLVRELARTEGLQLMEVNFELRPDAKQAFTSLEPAEILKSLALLGFPIDKHGLLFLDEVQECPAAIAALRYFYEKMPELAVVASGSLLEFAMESVKFPMPVGRIESLWLHPLSFSEYVQAKGNSALAEALDSMVLGHALPGVAHEKAMADLREYLFCGGMPAAAVAMAENGDVEASRRAHLSILQTYRQDFAKYAPKIDAGVAENLFLRAPGLVGGRLKYSHIAPDQRASAIRPAVDALEKAGVIRRVIHSAGQALPLITDANPRLMKLVLLDVGLMHAALRIEASLVQEPDLLAVHRGAVAEQFVAQELIACGPADREPELFFWAREALNSQAEVDYLVAMGSKVVPVEVKSGATGSLKSLRLFLDSHPSSPFGVRLHSSNAAVEERLLHLPLYAAGAIYRASRHHTIESSNGESADMQA